MSRDIVLTFLEASQAHRLHAPFVLLATTGMRRSEVVGLRWDDVDLDGFRVRPDSFATTAGNKIVIDGPKTRRFRGSIALDDDTVAASRSHLRRQAEERLVAGSEGLAIRTAASAVTPQR